MKWIVSSLCLCLAGVVILSGHGQEPKDGIQLQVVKYAGLMEAVQKNRGKVVFVDFWGSL